MYQFVARHYTWLYGFASVVALGVIIYLASEPESVAYAATPTCENAQAVAVYAPDLAVPGGGFGENGANHNDPSTALGPPDELFVALGDGGQIILEFTLLADRDGIDIKIREIFSNLIEEFDTMVGNDLSGPWKTVAPVIPEVSGSGFLSELNIGDEDGMGYRYLKITDDQSGDGIGTSAPGFDLNAAAAADESGDCEAPPRRQQ